MAATGKGHLTDVAIAEAMKPFEIKINFEPGIFQSFHPNAMLFEAYNASGDKTDEWMVYSIGGGDLSAEGISIVREPIYTISTMKEVLEWCESNGKTLWEFVETHENKEFGTI